MGDRPRHQRSDIEQILRDAEASGWVFTRRNEYFRGKCSCEGKHMRTVHATPSSPRYAINLRKWFERTCWKGER